MKLVKLIFIILGSFAVSFFFGGTPLLGTTSWAMDHTKPQLLKDKLYKEFWEEHFLFDDGTFVTCQFLVANFPWPVGDDHGIMIATVVSPDGQRTIIKNGRNLGEWGFDNKKLDIFIHVHRLRNHKGLYILDLGAEGKNEVHTTVMSQVSVPAGHLPEGQGDDKRFDHASFKNKGRSMESAFFLPYFSGEGRWAIEQGKGKALKSGAGKVQGFGTHVIINGRLDEVLTNWLRVSGLRGKDPQPIPFLSAITRPDGKKDIILTLMDGAGNVTRFSDVVVDYQDIKSEEPNSSYPTVIVVKAKNKAGNGESLSGTIRLTRKIDHFNIKDHLNFLEKHFARSRASVANYRYIAEYDFLYDTGNGTQRLEGKALSEYQDILPPQKRKKKKTKRKR